MAEEQDTVDRVVAQAGKLAGWLARTSWQAASRLPGGEAAQRQFRKARRPCSTRCASGSTKKEPSPAT
ncbi:hypothetical protein [Kibdelosporangium philippinense]|uniref:hypothetical protein n=1 Tax=Kibdelosporangium philippinense TaxID=211113 RepID=UPI00361FFB58